MSWCDLTLCITILGIFHIDPSKIMPLITFITVGFMLSTPLHIIYSLVFSVTFIRQALQLSREVRSVLVGELPPACMTTTILHTLPPSPRAGSLVVWGCDH